MPIQPEVKAPDLVAVEDMTDEEFFQELSEEEGWYIRHYRAKCHDWRRAAELAEGQYKSAALYLKIYEEMLLSKINKKLGKRYVSSFENLRVEEIQREKFAGETLENINTYRMPFDQEEPTVLK